MALRDFQHRLDRSPARGKSKSWADNLLRARAEAERRTRAACAAAYNARGGRPLRKQVEASRDTWLSMAHNEQEVANVHRNFAEKLTSAAEPGPADFEHERAIAAQARLEESAELRAAYDRDLYLQVRKAARKELGRKARIRRLLRNLSRMTPEQVADYVIDGEGLAQLVAFEGKAGVRRHLQGLLRKPSTYARDFIENLKRSAFGTVAVILSTVRDLAQAARVLSRLLAEEPIQPSGYSLRSTDAEYGATLSRFAAQA